MIHDMNKMSGKSSLQEKMFALCVSANHGHVVCVCEVEGA